MDYINYFSDSDRPLSRLFIISCAIHFAVVGTLFIADKLELISLSSLEKTNIRLAQASVRVDIVAMPKYTIKELKAMVEEEQAAPAPAEEVKQEAQEEKSEENAYEVQKKKQDFMSMLRTLSQKKVDAPKQDKKTQKAEKTLAKGPSDSMGKAMRGRLNKLVIAGNQLGSGSSIVGNGNGEKQDALDHYASSLPDLVRPQWKLPSYLLNRDLTCRVKLFLSQTGELIKAEIFESSGDREYDSRALSAVKISAPFPALPSEIQGFGSKGAIVLGFPL